MIDTTVPPSTTFDNAVAFEIGRADLAPGDSITITDVRGTATKFAVGGEYRVRGEYTLASADHAQLSLTVTSDKADGTCTRSDGRNVATVSRGSGTFELVAAIPYPGYPHVYFADSSKRGVYFGKDSFLRR